MAIARNLLIFRGVLLGVVNAFLVLLELIALESVPSIALASRMAPVLEMILLQSRANADKDSPDLVAFNSFASTTALDMVSA